MVLADEEVAVAQLAKLDLRVTKTRSKSRLRLSSHGAYASLQVNTVRVDEPSQPLYTTAGPRAFWLAVLADATAAVTALPGP